MKKALFNSFNMFVRAVAHDGMLVVMLFAPVLIGCIFRFFIPFAVAQWHLYFLEKYYLLFDLFLMVLTPILWCFASALTMLDEMDLGVTRHLMVTPLGRRGYLLSRLLFPVILVIPVTLGVVMFASLTSFPFGILCLMVFASAIMSVIPALLIVTFAENRVEGMAMGKLSGLVSFGLLVPFFSLGLEQYLFAILPSFWLAKFALTSHIGYYVMILLTTFFVSSLLYHRYQRKLI